MLLDNGSYDESIRQLTQVVQRDRRQATAWYLLAQAQRIKEMYPQSIESARQWPLRTEKPISGSSKANE